MQEIVKSVGIDIGTSTTQLVFSRLLVENLAGSGAARLDCAERGRLSKQYLLYSAVVRDRD